MKTEFQPVVESNILADFRMKMGEVLSFCESEPEKIFILHLYNYFVTHKKDGWQKFENLKFIEDFMFPHDPQFYDTEEQQKELYRYIDMHSYRNERGCYTKFNSFKATVTYPETHAMRKKRPFYTDGQKNCNIYQEYVVQPQYEVHLDDENYRIDIAIFLNRSQEGKIVDSARIGLECDGYDLHSSPLQKKNDDIRTRRLKRAGWDEIFRYSENEINSLSTSDFIELFEEIEGMFYRK